MRRFVTKSARIESLDEGHPDAEWAALFRKFAEGAEIATTSYLLRVANTGNPRLPLSKNLPRYRIIGCPVRRLPDLPEH